MEKKSKIVILAIFVFIIGAIAGGLVCNAFVRQSNDESNNENDTSSSAVSSLSTEASVEDNTYANDYCKYFNGITNIESKEIYNQLNDNKIDKYYISEIEKDSSPDNEIQMISDWINAYNKEYTNAYNCLTEQVKNSDDENAEKLLEYLNKYNDCNEYPQIVSSLTYYSENLSLGNGTGHSYDGLINELNYERERTLTIIEMLYLLNVDYTWI
jgi:hypothetical protein